MANFGPGSAEEGDENCCGKGTDDFDMSDEEGDFLAGRISPCTFRLWAEGCER
jgi:hypothetical protein